ncbi:hypothetical protein [Devosia marina]|uniref:hypothetical protein n=1 Tax=Devosia marina TaxID=2683198 RepID=UPI001FE77CBA|nr:MULTISPECIES: hypothetical protein [Hyphomicrobiales]
MVASAINLAVGLDISEAAIGLTIVAVRTSLPELATSLLAARRRESGKRQVYVRHIGYRPSYRPTSTRGEKFS